MKLKFFLLTFLLLFVRGCDFYSTSLWFFQENGMQGETNPLTVFFGVGWNGLILVNVLIVSLTVAMYAYYCFRYKAATSFTWRPANYREYASIRYFDRPDRFFQIFYKTPRHPKVLMAHAGYVLVRVVIIGSILATIHNLGQYYEIGAYGRFREMVGRPLFVIYGAIFVAMMEIYRRLLVREYAEYRAALTAS